MKIIASLIIFSLLSLNTYSDRSAPPRELVQKKVDQYISTPFKVAPEADNGLLVTNFGYKVDMACLDQWGMDFLQLVKGTLDEGLRCLEKLDRKSSSEGSGARQNAFDLLNLLSQNRISLICSQREYDWVAAQAHASVTSKFSIEKPSTAHPFISLRPLVKSATSEQVQKIRKTIFHEQFHNLGFTHSKSIEYPYTCADCCFNKASTNKEQEIKKLACKICTGNYQSVADAEYIEDYLFYAKKYFRFRQATRAAVNSIKNNPKTLLSLSILAWATSDVFNPIGRALATIIEKESVPLSEKIKINLERARYFNVKFGAKSGALISQSYYHLYYKTDALSSIKILKENKEALRSEINLLKKGKKSKFIGERIEQHLNDLIYDMWINKYGDEEGKMGISKKAYELKKFFKLK